MTEQGSLLRVVISLRHLWDRDMGRCHLCGYPVALEHATRDHIQPREFGGTNRLGNLALAHCWCNHSRQTRDHLQVDATYPGRWKALRHVLRTLMQSAGLTWHPTSEERDRAKAREQLHAFLAEHGELQGKRRRRGGWPWNQAPPTSLRQNGAG